MDRSVSALLSELHLMSLPEITYRFDELHLVPSTCAFASGLATVAYDDDGDWTITGLQLEHEHTRSKLLPLDREHPMHRVIRDALQLQDADAITARVMEELCEDGVRMTPPYAEHRLGAAALGVGR